MNNRIDVLGKIGSIIILIILAQIPIYFMQQYAISLAGNDYFSHLQTRAYNYANQVIESVQGEHLTTASINMLDNYRFVIDTLNSNYLVLSLVFLWLLVIDIVSSRKLSWFNYFIVTIGLVLFYLFELVLAHYLQISLFYFISMAVTIVLSLGYLSGTFKHIMTTITYGIGVVLIYVLSYYLVSYVNNPLVYLTICLLTLFVVVIVITRNINWHERPEVTKGGAKKLN